MSYLCFYVLLTLCVVAVSFADDMREETVEDVTAAASDDVRANLFILRERYRAKKNVADQTEENTTADKPESGRRFGDEPHVLRSDIESKIANKVVKTAIKHQRMHMKKVYRTHGGDNRPTYKQPKSGNLRKHNTEKSAHVPEGFDNPLSDEERKLQVSARIDKLRPNTLRHECASNPCQNGGTCVAKVDGYSCTCDWINNGPNCENVLLKPRQYTLLGTYKNHTYYYQVSVKMNYTEAQSNCRKYGMDLIALETPEEHQWLNDNWLFGANTTNTWAGADMLDGSSTYKWAVSGDDVNMNQEGLWHTGRPTTSRSSRCVSFWPTTKTLVNTECSSEKYYICEQFYKQKFNKNSIEVHS